MIGHGEVGQPAMTHKSATSSKPLIKDRRSGVDRRKVDVPRPGLPDRRRAVDSRKPEVIELDMSNSEWSALNQEPMLPRKGR
jgi:hypothetical protein